MAEILLKCHKSSILFVFISLNHEKEIKDLTNQIRDLDRQREAALREVAELKTQLKLVEEARDNVRRDLIDSNRRVREGEIFYFFKVRCITMYITFIVFAFPKVDLIEMNYSGCMYLLSAVIIDIQI